MSFPTSRHHRIVHIVASANAALKRNDCPAVHAVGGFLRAKPDPAPGCTFSAVTAAPQTNVISAPSSGETDSAIVTARTVAPALRNNVLTQGDQV